MLNLRGGHVEFVFIAAEAARGQATQSIEARMRAHQRVWGFSQGATR